MVAEILGPEMLVVLGIIAVLFGGSQIPKLARSLGSAQREFKRGIEDGNDSTAQSDAVAK